MDGETGAETRPSEAGAEAGAQEGEYGLHIRLDRKMQPVLDKAAELACEMDDIQKPTLNELINLFINWGLFILKKKCTARYYK